MIDRDDAVPTPMALQALKPVETWHQDDLDPGLWHHASGLIVNDAALDERASYYRVVRLHTVEATVIDALVERLTL